MPSLVQVVGMGIAHPRTTDGRPYSLSSPKEKWLTQKGEPLVKALFG